MAELNSASVSARTFRRPAAARAPKAEQNSTARKGAPLTTQDQLCAGMKVAAEMVEQAGKVTEVLRPGYRTGEDDCMYYNLPGASAAIKSALENAGFVVREGADMRAEGFVRALAYFVVYNINGACIDEIDVQHAAEMFDELSGITAPAAGEAAEEQEDEAAAPRPFRVLSGSTGTEVYNCLAYAQTTQAMLWNLALDGDFTTDGNAPGSALQQMFTLLRSLERDLDDIEAMLDDSTPSKFAEVRHG